MNINNFLEGVRKMISMISSSKPTNQTETENDYSRFGIRYDEQSTEFIDCLLKGNNSIEGARFIGCSKEINECEDVEVIRKSKEQDEYKDAIYSPEMQKYSGKTNFASRMKSVNEEIAYRKLNPNIEEWKRQQKENVLELKDEAISHFNWVANIGQLNNRTWNPQVFKCWSEDVSNVSNAEAITKEIVREVFEPYGIKVEEVLLTRQEREITVTLKI